MPKSENQIAQLIKTWVLPADVTLGSAIRIKGIYQEIRTRLSPQVKKAVELDGNELILIMPAAEKLSFQAVSATISQAVADAPTLPIIPREIEDILTIKTSERKRWLEDGRLQSAGTRTVKLRGRAKKITFHVFEPKVIADILDRGLVDEWREDDIAAAAEKRRAAAYKAKLTRSLRKSNDAKAEKTPIDGASQQLSDWEEFARDGLLR